MVDYTVVIIRLSQSSLAGVGAGAELGNIISFPLKVNPTVMVLAPRFDRGLSEVKILSNLSFGTSVQRSSGRLLAMT